ncbi:uncharacterized protein PG998_001393 [Apiospora kogelbergensis]|uniref:uncharacterized protein n=1 Tax=Apiospora kogelbergensis TaxID=1337665 RepID=UPI00312FBC01
MLMAGRRLLHPHPQAAADRRRRTCPLQPAPVAASLRPRPHREGRLRQMLLRENPHLRKNQRPLDRVSTHRRPCRTPGNMPMKPPSEVHQRHLLQDRPLPRDRPKRPLTAMKTRRPGAASASARHTLGACAFTPTFTPTFTAPKDTRFQCTSGAAFIIETCPGTPTKKCAGSTASPSFRCAAAATLTEFQCAATTSFAELQCTTTTTSAELECTTTTTFAEFRRSSAAATAPDASCAGGAPPPPPPPPPPANRDSGYGSGVPAAALPSTDSSRSAMLGDIQKAGGIAALKKVDRSKIRDRSGATVGGSGDTGPHGSGLPPAGMASGGGGGMADALAAALQKRKQKVGDSDDEKTDDEW